jgi:hypothetical protein
MASIDEMRLWHSVMRLNLSFPSRKEVSRKGSSQVPCERVAFPANEVEFSADGEKVRQQPMDCDGMPRLGSGGAVELRQTPGDGSRNSSG